MMTKFNKTDVERMIEAIKEYFASHCVVIRVLLVYVIRKTIIIQIFSDYPKYATSDDEMIARMIHLPPDKSRLLLGHNISSVREQAAEYKINNRTVYDILDQIGIHVSNSISPSAGD